MRISVAVIVLFSRDLTTLDILLISAMFLVNHSDVVAKMRSLPLITMGITVPLVVSPVMLDVWVQRGTGNANYFFFQGLCLWLFCALGITEFCSALLRKSTLCDKPESLTKQ